MKDKSIFIILIVIIFLLVLCFLMFNRRGKNVFVSDLKSFSFSYSTGTMIYARVRYEISLKNNKYSVTIYQNGVSDDEIKEFTVSEDFISKLEEILNKYEVSKWDGFDKSNKYVLDGNSFSLNVYFMDDKNVNASGYEEWPSNYNNVRSELDNLFSSLIK